MSYKPASGDTISVPYGEEVRLCAVCYCKSFCRCLFKTKRVSQTEIGIPEDSAFFCFNCARGKLEESEKIRQSCFTSKPQEPSIWIELRLTQDGREFFI